MTKEVFLEGNKGKFVHECKACQCVYTYTKDDVVVGALASSVECPECGNKAYITDMIPFSWKTKKFYNELNLNRKSE